jgi:hypothetical protein
VIRGATIRVISLPGSASTGMFLILHTLVLMHTRTASRRHRPPQPHRRDPAPPRVGASSRHLASPARDGDVDLACMPEPRPVHVLALMLALASGHCRQPQPRNRRLCSVVALTMASMPRAGIRPRSTLLPYPSETLGPPELRRAAC